MSTFFVNEADPTVAKGNNSRLAVEPGVSAPSRVGGTVRIEGEIYGKQDMLVEGEIAGSVMVPEHTLTIGPEANVKANIKARNVVVLGNVEGSIEASESIEIRSCCTLLGDIWSPRIMVENGAYIKGTIEVVRQAAGDSGPTPALKVFAAAVSSFDEAVTSVDACPAEVDR
jgi:cytoskeletal protein CcmA (bactofilin family)